MIDAKNNICRLAVFNKDLLSAANGIFKINCEIKSICFLII